MGWLRHVIIDILVTVLIVLLIWQDWEWTEVVIWIYTPLMIVLKLVALNAGSIARLQTSRGEVPELFFHVLYGLNILLLLIGARWILAVLWLVIWGLSAWDVRR